MIDASAAVEHIARLRRYELPAASYITGHTLTVDGGMSIQGLAMT